MKNLFKPFVGIFMSLMATSTVSAHITGKVYQPGDTIKLDEVTFLVYKTDDTGMHGSALSPYARSEKEIEKLRKKTLKHFGKEIKKGKASQEELDDWLSQIDAISKIPLISTETDKDGRIYRVDKWYGEVPEGWRLPSQTDAADFATFFCGGLGQDYAKINLLGSYKTVTSDLMQQTNIMLIAFKGMIVCDSDDPKDVRFMNYYTKKLTAKSWLEIKEKYLGGEKTVAIKDF